jgi:arylsulfatase A-like enzyme
MTASQPNIVFITADNQPATLLGCYGNADVYTPNIDRMAAEGTRFEWAFSTNGMCSPGRASMFTGLMPSMHGVHNWLDDKYLKDWPSDWCAVREFRTLATAFSGAGYRTALIGKYHLGHPSEPMPGFDDWIAFATGHTTDWYHNDVIEEGVRHPVHGKHIVQYFTEKAEKYIDNVDSSKPFFLNINYDAPYLLPPSCLGPDHQNPYYSRFEGKPLPSFPRTAIGEGLLRRIEGPDDTSNFYLHHLYGYLRMHNDPASMANVCAQVAIVDEGVGRIVQALRDRGLENNTLVVYTADQSNLYGQHGLWGHTMDTDPSHLYDAGLHIPLIVWRPGSVAAGAVDNRLISQVDYPQTLSEYAGLKHTNFKRSPGRSFAACLQGVDDRQQWQDVVFFEQEESRGIQTPRFSLWQRMHDMGETVLFDMEKDPEQEHNVAELQEYQDTVVQLSSRLAKFFEQNADPRYDLWQGGRPKGSTRKMEAFRRLFGDDWAPSSETECQYVEPSDQKQN